MKMKKSYHHTYEKHTCKVQGNQKPTIEGQIIKTGNQKPTIEGQIINTGNQKPTIEGQIINTGNQKPTNEGQIINTNTITNKDKRKKNDRLNITQKI
jgi:hypothetical protein